MTLETAPGTQTAPPDLADHFLACSKLGRYLTLFDESRFVITDDFAPSQAVLPAAAAMASIFSKDPLVAHAALVPLGFRARSGSSRRMEYFEELFSLIEEQALSDDVRAGAKTLLQSGFREARIRELEAELGGKINPARIRYRDFLGIVKQLMDRKIDAAAFRDEFVEFTYAVAGKLDFGIYSFCLDRIFGNRRIAMKAKGYLVSELLGFPPAIRRELLTNLLTAPDTEKRLTDFVRDAIKQKLGRVASTEIDLLVALKSSEMSMDDITQMIAGTA